MKSRSLLLPLILATTASMADTQPLAALAGAQAQAAALLSGTHPSGTLGVDGRTQSSSTIAAAMDAQASAAALLSRPLIAGAGNARDSIGQPSTARISGDAQAQAAALLGGRQSSTESWPQAQLTKSGMAR